MNWLGVVLGPLRVANCYVLLRSVEVVTWLRFFEVCWVSASLGRENRAPGGLVSSELSRRVSDGICVCMCVCVFVKWT